ncbi:MAG: hypothetical protein GEV08_11390 [Acidimicrobiia bacterium]|nr:hypothetical protein [Acidimicrobiia bacterium]
MSTPTTTTGGAPPTPPSATPGPGAPQPAARAPRPAGHRKAWVVVGTVFALVSLAWGTLMVVGSVAYDRWDLHSTHDERIRAVDVEAEGAVRIEPATGSELVVDTRVTRGLFETTTSERVEGDRLVLRSDCPALFDVHCGADYTIQVPAGVAVLAHASGGGIQVSGVEGDLELSASGGGIRVEDASGRLDLDASGGGITATGLTSAVVAADSSGGGVSLAFARPPEAVDVGASGGGVTVELPDTPHTYRVEASSSGGLTRNQVRTDPTSERAIEASSSGGGVTVRYPRG